MKRLVIFIVGVVIVLLCTMPTAGQAQAPSYREGFSIVMQRGDINTPTTLRITAFKDVVAGVASSYVYVQYIEPGTVYIDELVPVPDDPDRVGVSEDLGWGGLKGMMLKYNNLMVGRPISATFELSLYANADATAVPGSIIRPAKITGWISIGDTTIAFEGTDETPNERAYVFRGTNER